MSRIVPDGFVTISQAIDELVTAVYSGIPDRPIVRELKEKGSDVMDGEAHRCVNETLWDAVDRGSIEAFVVGPRCPTPFRLSAKMTEGIPMLRSARGRDFAFLRPSRGYLYNQLTSWFGSDLSQVLVVFRQRDINRLARTRLRARRRKASTAKNQNVGRPSRQIRIKPLIRQVADKGRWSSKQSQKALTVHVNRLLCDSERVSQATVTRALDDLYAETRDRRFERLPRRMLQP